ncbi:hypothetical protein SAMN06265222_114117 [Neorhodopirellula lusitana]|uniref:Uncharacterized protein n=1 Tax=Neorhodopirellula lusitana TaxID=445327 RepID=A0ABY1QJZ3_9BACT|nr:hypothetical protein SAMN06265222_114117 [Neorhodopirellula lusitana]
MEVSGSVVPAVLVPNLLAWANGTGKTAVVDAVGGVPKWLAEFNATAKDFDFLWAACWGICCTKVLIFLRDEIFVVTVAKDGFEDVLAMTHTLFDFPDSTSTRPGTSWS